MLRSVLVIASAFVLCIVSTAQDGSGRSSGVRTVTPRTYKIAARPRPARRMTPPARPIRPVELGRLILFVNEASTVAEIIRNGPEPRRDIVAVPGRTSGQLVRTLTEGNYTVIVRKAGYRDEVRGVQIEDGRRNRLQIVMQPVMAFLSVRPSIADAVIEVERIGTFLLAVRRHPVPPGSYRVSVTKRGYITRQFRVDLARPGREEILNVVLKPLRIDSVLALAAEHLRKGEIERGRQLADDVLSLHPMHGRANRLRGMSDYLQGDRAAVGDLIKAVSRGEPVTLQANLQDADGRLSPGEIEIDRESVALKNSLRPELNFRIARNDLTQLERIPDANSVPTIYLAGRSQFHGRPIQPSLRIRSIGAFLLPGGKPGCQAMFAKRTCESDIDILFELLSALTKGRLL